MRGPKRDASDLKYPCRYLSTSDIISINFSVFDCILANISVSGKENGFSLIHAYTNSIFF